MSTIVDGTSGVSLVQDGVVVQADLAANVAGTGPLFVVTPTALNAGSSAILQSYTKVVDTNNYFNASTGTFQPLIGGYYLFTATVQMDAATGFRLELLKNGATAAYGPTQTGSTTLSATVSFLMYMNGSTDTAQLRISTASAFTTTAGATISYFAGCLVRKA
jgi:hypothetical protein